MSNPLLLRRCMVLMLVISVTHALAGDEDPPAFETAIRQVLDQQAEAWNRGDIDAFMQHYWKSDELTFSSGGKTTRGWEATRQNYKRRYPTPEKMGRVAFSDLEFRKLGESAALVLGRWKVEREEELIGGNFSLVFRRIRGNWRIVHDHTSRDASD